MKKVFAVLLALTLTLGLFASLLHLAKKVALLGLVQDKLAGRNHNGGHVGIVVARHAIASGGMGDDTTFLKEWE